MDYSLPGSSVPGIFPGRNTGVGCHFLLQGIFLTQGLICIYEETGLEEVQAGIKISRRNIHNLRYADDATLVAETQEELKSPLMKVKEESEKAG